ncbi:hypothetical protein GCM10010266_33920 [Streptomyces griseomycini]|nr:hypothetical protein GCM10010266_33920 [Streptomyces griseomycini]
MSRPPGSPHCSPQGFLTRPAGILAFRLRETPLPAPPPDPLPPVPGRPAVLSFKNCDGCERAFRAPEPGHCRDCRGHLVGGPLRAAGRADGRVCDRSPDGRLDTPYGLVPKRIATDGVDIFVEHGLGDLRRPGTVRPPSTKWSPTASAT